MEQQELEDLGCSRLADGEGVMPQPCSEQEQIARSITMVMSRILILHIAELQAIRKRDLDEMERIDRKLEKELGHRSSLLEKFQGHLESHGCQPVKALR